MTENEKYLAVMLAKLLYALQAKEAGVDGNWGRPSFSDEIKEMLQSLKDIDCVKNGPRKMFL